MTGTSNGAFPTLGILGGGQLGRMTALAAIPMGVNVRFLAPEPSGPMLGLGTTHIGDWTDPQVLQTFAQGCTAITVESEWAPAEHLARVLPESTPVWPHPRTLKMIRDKGVQKQVLQDGGLPLPDHASCATLEEAWKAAADFGYPVMLKRFQGSYDGYGNATVRNEADLETAWPRLVDENGLLVEAWVPFIRELAVMVARRADGAHVMYPVTYTEQRDHRCHAVVAPAGISRETARLAQDVSLAAVEAIDGVGVTGVELFELADGKILVNELAPRPHNTGHYTIEGCHTSQFENHVRAVLGWPLGDPALRTPCAVMINVLGHRTGIPSTEGLEEALSMSDVAVHIYGKQAVKPKRKMGHVTALGTDPVITRHRAEKAAGFIQL